MIGRFEEGVGEGDAKQLSDLRTALWQYKDMTPQRISESYRIPEAVSKSRNDSVRLPATRKLAMSELHARTSVDRHRPSKPLSLLLWPQEECGGSERNVWPSATAANSTL